MPIGKRRVTCLLNVIVHYPTAEKDIIELQKMVSAIHIEAVTSYLQKLNCPKEQKLKMVNELKN